MSLNFTSISVEKNLRRNNNDSYEPAGMKEKTYYSTIENKLIRYEISEQPKNILIKKTELSEVFNALRFYASYLSMMFSIFLVLMAKLVLFTI